MKTLNITSKMILANNSLNQVFYQLQLLKGTQQKLQKSLNRLEKLRK